MLITPERKVPQRSDTSQNDHKSKGYPPKTSTPLLCKSRIEAPTGALGIRLFIRLFKIRLNSPILVHAFPFSGQFDTISSVLLLLAVCNSRWTDPWPADGCFSPNCSWGPVPAWVRSMHTNSGYWFDKFVHSSSWEWILQVPLPDCQEYDLRWGVWQGQLSGF